MTSEALDLAVIEDRKWRASGTMTKGGCYVTIFTGPAAEARARAYFEALKSGPLSPMIPDKVPR
jgi:uncharacterized membrane protein